MVLQEKTFTQVWDRLKEIGLTDDEAQERIRRAQESIGNVISICKNNRHAYMVIQCEIVEESGEDHEKWFMQG
jgi:hypothetical protein